MHRPDLAETPPGSRTESSLAEVNKCSHNLLLALSDQDAMWETAKAQTLGQAHCQDLSQVCVFIRERNLSHPQTSAALVQSEAEVNAVPLLFPQRSSFSRRQILDQA